MAKRRRRKNKYIEYDYESLFGNELDMNEFMVDYLLKTGKVKCIYATKEIRAGEQLEIELYPEFTRAQAKKENIPERDKKKQRERQKDLNNKNSRKLFWRLAEHNFASGDYWLTLVYDEEHLPKDMEEATANIQRFLRNINGKRKRRGLPNAKYLYTTEVVTEYGEAVRVHHHLMLDQMLPLEEVERTWKYGRRNECRHIEKDRDGITGASIYMTKQSKDTARKKYAKRWSGSLNLERPPEHKHHQTRKKDIDEMVRDREHVKTFTETSVRYTGYEYAESTVYYNDHNARFYIYIRMRRKDDKTTEKRCRGDSRRKSNAEGA